MNLRVTEQYSLTGAETLFGQMSLLRSTACCQRGGAMWSVGRWMVLSADRTSGNAIRSGSDITVGLENEGDSSNNQDKRDEGLERKRWAFHGDDNDEQESACAVVVGGGVPGTLSRVFCGGVLYSKRLVSDSTSRERKAGNHIGRIQKQGHVCLPFLLFWLCVTFVACCLLLALVTSRD